MSSVEWFCKIAGREIGPLSSQQVVEMARAGQIRPGDFVRKGNQGAWVAARQVKGLAFLATTTTVPEISPLAVEKASGHSNDAATHATSSGSQARSTSASAAPTPIHVPEAQPLPDPYAAASETQPGRKAIRASSSRLPRKRTGLPGVLVSVAIGGLTLSALGVVGLVVYLKQDTRDTPSVASSGDNVSGTPRTDCSSIGLKLVLIPAGEFLMGGRETPEELNRAFMEWGENDTRVDEELPSHRVRLTRPFYMGACEVTRGQFSQFVSETDHRTDAEKGESKGLIFREHVNGKVKPIGPKSRHPEGSWRNVGFPQSDEHPVVGVSWNDATAFCQWLSRKEGKTYRLPTEAEWEYACRSGTQTRYSFGDSPIELIDHAWYSEDATHPVAQKKANAWGLYDMHGNAAEWCADGLRYSRDRQVDPQGEEEGNKAFRGGSWRAKAVECRSARRDRDYPSYKSIIVGFRVARSL